ncbi:MAG TPA: hypothetical protein VEZ11_13130 [Thermoanaerobaculia bacterium]|nr:hypothetical protein [Thermoanaerobaculia bacterium]
MLQPLDQPLDFSGAQLGARKLERHRTAEGSLRREKPLDGCVPITIEELERAAGDARCAQQSIGLRGEQPAGLLPPRQGASRDVDEGRDLLERKRKVLGELLDRAVRQTAFNVAQEGAEFEGPQPQENGMAVWA